MREFVLTVFIYCQGYLTKFHTVTYGIELAANFVLCILTIIMKGKPADRERKYSSIQLSEEKADGQDVWIVTFHDW